MLKQILMVLNFTLSIAVGVLVTVDYFYNIFEKKFFEDNAIIYVYIMLMCIYGVYNFVVSDKSYLQTKSPI